MRRRLCELWWKAGRVKSGHRSRRTEAESENGAEQLSSAGVPLKADREERWQAFVSMRSQYDFALIALANFLHAPEAPWSSDRTLGLTVRDLVR